MKKILSLFLTALLLPFSLGGCTAAPTDSASRPSDLNTNAASATNIAPSENPSTDTSHAVSSESSDADTTDSVPESSASTQIKPESPQDILEATPHLVGLTDQKNARLIVRDLAAEDWSDDSSVVWEFKDPRVAAAAGIKLRNCEIFGGEVVLFCGPKGAGIVSYETKEVLYFTSHVGVNPHAVELLPDGTFIVGSTTDNLVSVFAAASGSMTPVQTLTYENVHGALWDPEYKVVWMAGRSKLSAFAVSGSANNPRLSQIQGMVYSIGDWLHDLVPCFGNPQGLFVTAGTGIYFFDKETEKFSTQFPCSDYAASIKTSPAMGQFPDNVMTLIAVVSGKTVYREWCMNEVTVLIPSEKLGLRKITRIAPNDAYYKVRVWIPDYQ